MRAPSRHFFQIAGSILVLSAPLMAQTTPPAPAVAPRDTTTWTTFKGDPQGTNSTTANVKLPLSLQWRYSSDAISREFLTSPLVIGAPGHQVVAFGAGRNVIALDPQTGAQAWKSPDFTSEILTPPTLLSGENGDLIIVAQSSGRVDALRTSDGGRVWEIDALSSITNSGPVIANTAKGKRIICALTAGRLIALNLDGSIDPSWTVSLGRYGITPTTAMTLSADGKLLYICGSDAKLYVIDLIKGGPAYTVQLSANSSVTPVIAGDLLVTANVRLVSGYKASGGANIWNFDPRGEVLGSPAIGTDATGKTMIYFGTRTGLFYGLDATGAQVWKADVGAGISGIPLVLPKMVIVGTSNGMLIGFDPANGAIIWQYRLKTERAIQQTNNNNGGGGGFGGRRGGFGGGATANTATMQIWGVSAAPSAVDGQLFVLADNAALYSFTTAPFDAAPPRVIEPSIAVPNDQDTITSLLLTPQNPQIVPGRGPIYFATQLDDTGSGVDPKSISIIVDGLPVASDSVNFDIASGVLTVTLLDPKKGGTGFPDGLKNILLNASDYAGNKLEFNTTFNIDNTAASPSATQQTGRGGRGGFGGFGGRGGFGGNPDGGVDGGGDGNPDGNGGNPFGGNPDGNGGDGNPDGGTPDGGGEDGGAPPNAPFGGN